MSLHVVYVTEAAPHHADGPHVATSQGWTDWCDWVLARGDRYPECAYLTDDPVDEAAPGSLARLAAEFPRVAAESRAESPDVAGVAEALARAMAERPTGCVGVYVSDGEANEDEEALEDEDNG